jgi:hypothetical protein
MSSVLQCDSPCVNRTDMCLVHVERVARCHSHFALKCEGNENGLCWFEEGVGPKGSHCLPQIDLLSRLEHCRRQWWFCSCRTDHMDVVVWDSIGNCVVRNV